MWGIFEVFADTVIICSCTSLCILCSGIKVPWGSVSGSGLFLSSLETVFGQKLSAFMLAVFIGLFAYTSIIGWAFYGERCAEYVFGHKAISVFHFFFVLLLIPGSILSLEFVWNIADFINALMSIPNLIALIILSPVVISSSSDSFT